MFDDILGPDKPKKVKKSVKLRLEKYCEEEKQKVETSEDEKCRPVVRCPIPTNGSTGYQG